MSDIYFACSKNVKELKKQSTAVIRLLNQALRENRHSEIQTLTKLYALMYSAYAEVSFLKLIHTPHGFQNTQIEQIKACSSLDAKWSKCLDLAFIQIENSQNKGDIANKKQILSRLLEKYIIAPSQIRNKVAHGQWAVCLNNSNTAINNDTTAKVSQLDFVQIQRLFNIYNLFAQCIEDLIESPYRAHFRFFYSTLDTLNKYVASTENYTLESKKLKLQTSVKFQKYKPSNL